MSVGRWTPRRIASHHLACLARDASDDDLREALEDVETAARGGAKRYYRVRGCYLYRVRTDDGIEFRYVGESEVWWQKLRVKSKKGEMI